MPTLYDILGVENNADSEVLRQAYRKLARRYHPDVNPDPRSHDLMARINDAFSTLIDPDRRTEYDAMLTGGFGGGEPNQDQPKRPMQIKLVRRLKGHRTPVYAVSWQPDTGQLVSCSFDNELIFWDAGLEEPERRTKLESGAVSTVRAVGNDRVIGSGAVETMISIWDVRNGRVVSQKTSDQEWVGAVAISPDGEHVATGSIHNVMGIHRTVNGHVRIEREEHEQSITAVTWNADGRVVATGSADNTVKLWSATNGDLIHTFKAIRSAVSALAFSGDGRFLAAAAVDLSIRVFSLGKGTLDKMMFGHTKPIEALAFHPNGWLFASCGRDGSVKLWNADKGLGQLHIDASVSPLLTLEFSPDGKYLAAAGLDRIIRVWELNVREEG